MSRDFRHDTEAEPNIRSPSPVSELVERLEDVAGFIQKEHGRVAATEAASTLSTLSTRIVALEAQLAERGKTEREIEYDVYSKIRRAFRRALSELPEIAPLEIRRVLSSVHMRNEFLNEGKRLQRTHGTDAVAPRVEQECGAGAWLFMRNGILSALEATPPAPKVTDVEFRLLEVGETLQSDDEVVDDNGKSWVPVDRWAVGTPYSRAFKSVRRHLTAAQKAGEP